MVLSTYYGQLITNMIAENGYQMPTSSVKHLLNVAIFSVLNIVKILALIILSEVLSFPRDGVVIDTTLLATGSGYGKTLALVTRGVHYYTHAAGSIAPMTIRKNPCSHHERGKYTSAQSSPVGMPRGLCFYTSAQSSPVAIPRGLCFYTSAQSSPVGIPRGLCFYKSAQSSPVGMPRGLCFFTSAQSSPVGIPRGLCFYTSAQSSPVGIPRG